MARVLLILPSATYRARDFVDAAAAMGVEVVIASEHRQALAGLMGDRALRVSLRDQERAADAIVAHAERHPLDGVVAVDDQGVIAAALAAERLGLPASPPEAVRATRDKARLRKRLAAAGVAQPAFRVVAAADDVAAAAADVGFPCVVKPVSLSASRGVIRADAPGEAIAAAERIGAILGEADAGGPLLVESYVDGPEVAVEGLLRDGHLDVLAVFDKPDPMEGPFFEETILVTPSRLPAAVQDAVCDTTARTAGALGLVEGPVHAELRLAGGAGGGADVTGTPTVLELAARSIGGLCSRALRFGMGVRLEELILRQALRQPLSGLAREAAASGVMMLPVPAAGVLQGVDGLDTARAVPGVSGVEITVGPGRPVRPLPEGDRYLGFVFARGDGPGQVEQALRAAHAALDVRIAEPAGEPVAVRPSSCEG